MFLKIARIKWLLTLLSVLMLGHAYTQDTTLVVSNTDSIPQKDSCEVKDATDYVRKWLKLKPKEQKPSSFFIAPVIGSTPSTGFLFGVALQGAFQLPNSKMSA